MIFKSVDGSLRMSVDEIWDEDPYAVEIPDSTVQEYILWQEEKAQKDATWAKYLKNMHEKQKSGFN